VTQDPMLIAADNCCVEARPSEPPHSLPVHAMMLIQHGIYLLENLELDALATARAYEFAFIVQPLKIKGATGSAIAPIAIRCRDGLLGEPMTGMTARAPLVRRRRSRSGSGYCRPTPK